MPSLGQVSGSFAIVACLMCFFLGRFSLSPPESLQVYQAVSKALPTGRRALQRTAGFYSQTSQPAIQPTGPAHLTQLVEKSGLLETKPPVTPGKSGNTEYTVAPFQVLSWYPRIVLYPNFIDTARCEHMINMAREKLQPTEEPVNNTEAAKAIQQRTSSGIFMPTANDTSGVLPWLDERIAAISQLPVENMEHYNILRYNQHQYCEPHLDAFDPKEFGPQESQRVATVLLILRAPEEGGETVFKLEGEGQKDRGFTPEEWRKCDQGDFMYKPRQGDALLFWSVTPKGDVDQQALHSGCPVTKGEKWVATKWIHDTPFVA